METKLAQVRPCSKSMCTMIPARAVIVQGGTAEMYTLTSATPAGVGQDSDAIQVGRCSLTPA